MARENESASGARRQRMNWWRAHRFGGRRNPGSQGRLRASGALAAAVSRGKSVARIFMQDMQ